MSMTRQSTQPPGAAKTAPAAERSFGRAAHWSVGLSAAALVLISVSGYFYHREQLSAIAAEHLRLIVTGPSSLRTGVGTEYWVSTTAINGQPLPAELDVTISTPDQKRLKAYRESVDEHGRLQVVVPADLPLPPRIILKVAAHHADNREEVELPIRVEPARYITQLSLDRPLYQPGETVFYRCLTLDGLTLAAGREMPVHFEISGHDDSVLPNSSRDAMTERGVTAGEFLLPEGLAAGNYTLVVRSPNGLFSNQKQLFTVSGYRSTSEKDASKAEPAPPAETHDADLSELRVGFFPEGGELVSGLENRVYFLASDSSGKPVKLSGKIVVKSHDDDGHDIDVATVQTTCEGRGTFSLIPQVGETYRLKITSPEGAVDEPILPEVTAERNLVLSTGSGVFAAGKPLEFNIRAAEAGHPLIVVAHCRDVQVGQQPLITKAGRSGANPVAITLDDPVGGLLRLIVYDYSNSPPKVVAEQLVYRRRGRKLKMRVDGLKAQYPPGEQVEISVLVTNEKDEPAAAALGVSVVDEAWLGPFEGRMPAMPDYFLLTSQIEKLDNVEPIDFYLSDQTKDDIPAAVALDLLLGTQTPSPMTVAPPAMFDNLDAIRSNYEKSLTNYRAGRSQALDTLTTASFFGGLGLVLLVAMLGLMRIVSGLHLWAAAIGATTCCLIIGAILTDPSRLATGEDTAVAFSPCCEPVKNIQQLSQNVAQPPSAVQNRSRQPGAAVPQHDFSRPVYWNPLLIAGSDGKAVIRFQLPDDPATFRVTINAHEAGRLGAERVEILSRTDDKPEPTSTPAKPQAATTD